MTPVLASGSQRRTSLLTAWGVPHEVLVPRGDEHLDTSLDPGPLTEALARQKVEEIRRAHDLHDRVVLGADTVVHLDGVHLGKPRDAEDACRILRSISGREVTVVTGVAVARGEEIVTAHEASRVTMESFDDEAIRWYVGTGEPMDKAGAFAVQGLGGRLVRVVEGSESNVIGLPRRLTLELLARFGVTPGTAT